MLQIEFATFAKIANFNHKLWKSHNIINRDIQNVEAKNLHPFKENSSNMYTSCYASTKWRRKQHHVNTSLGQCWFGCFLPDYGCRARAACRIQGTEANQFSSQQLPLNVVCVARRMRAQARARGRMWMWMCAYAAICQECVVCMQTLGS